MIGTFDSLVWGTKPWILKKLNELNTSDSFAAGLDSLGAVSVLSPLGEVLRHSQGLWFVADVGHSEQFVVELELVILQDVQLVVVVGTALDSVDGMPEVRLVVTAGSDSGRAFELPVGDC